MGRPWPFVGRERELANVQKALADGELTGAVLVGPPGVGKTRLARAVAERAETAGSVVRWVMATSSAADIPLGAMSQLMSSWDGPGTQAVHLLQHAARHLTDGANGARILLVVDDAHLLDPTSAALVHHLAVTGGASVVVTARTGVTVPEEIFALWKEGFAERIDIHGLDRTQADELVRQVLGGQVDGATLHHLWELSLGNALFLRELVEGGLASGALSPGGVWKWNGPFVPSPRLTELIDVRMGALEPDEQAVLELLAFGEPLGLDTPERVVGPDALASVERKGLVVSERMNRRVELRLAHPLYGEVIRQRTSPRREKEIYRDLAESLESSGLRRSGDRLRAVTWRLAAGLPTDADMLRVAAETTMGVDYRAAERLARAAVERGGGYAASFVLSQILIGLGRSTEAEEIFSGLWFRADTGEQRYQLAVTRVANLYWGLGRPVRAATVLRDLETGLGEASTPELRTLESALLIPDAGAEQATMLLDHAVSTNGVVDATTLQAVAVASASLRRAGRHEAALRVAERAHRAVEETGSPQALAAEWARVQLEAGRCESHTFCGALDEAERLGRAAYQSAVANDRSTAKAMFAGWVGLTNGFRGRMRTSLRWLRDATASVQPDGLPLLALLWTETVQAAVALGDQEAATAAMRQVRRALSEGGDAYAPWAGLAPAWTAVAGGRMPDAVAACLSAADHAERDGLRQAVLIALHTAVRLGAAATVAGRLEDAATGAEGDLVPLLVEHAGAAAKSDAERLDAVAGRFADLGALLLAAEASAQAAAVHRGGSGRGPGNASALRARQWARECEGARTPALAEMDSSSELTPREHEIAALAASGMTSRAIAERLVVSVRTVDNVLYAVYSKLGIGGRRDLASVVLPGNRPVSE